MNRYLLFLLAFLTGIFIYTLTEGNNFSIGGDTPPRCNNFGDKNTTTFLDLSNCSLTELPDLRGFNKLNTLYLYFGNDLSGSQTWNNINSSQLGILDLSNCSLTEIPDLSKFNSLTDLYLNGNDLSGSQTWNNISQLGILHLKNCGLTEIPDLRDFNSLQTLNLSYNDLSDIEVCKLKNIIPKECKVIIDYDNDEPIYFNFDICKYICPPNQYKTFDKNGKPSNCKSLIKGNACKPGGSQRCPGGAPCPKNGICLPDLSIKYKCTPKKNHE